MPTSLHGLAGCLLLVAAAGGCATNHWVVIQQATPNPLLGTIEFTVEVMSFEPPATKALLALKEGDASRAKLAQTFERTLTESAWRAGVRVLTTPPKPDGYVLRAKVVALETGWTTRASGGIGANHPAEVKLQVEIFDGKGKAIDVIRVEASDSGSATTTADRLAECGTALGADLSRYLVTRVFP